MRSKVKAARNKVRLIAGARPLVHSKLAARISQETPLSLFRAARKFLSARWSLRRATRVGKRVQLIGRLRVVNRKGTFVVGDRVRRAIEFGTSGFQLP